MNIDQLLNIAQNKIIPEPEDARTLALAIDKAISAVHVWEKMTNEIYFTTAGTPYDIAQPDGTMYSDIMRALSDGMRYDIEKNIVETLRLIANHQPVDALDWGRVFTYAEHIALVYKRLAELCEMVIGFAGSAPDETINAAFFAKTDVITIEDRPDDGALFMAPPTPPMIYAQ